MCQCMYNYLTFVGVNLVSMHGHIVFPYLTYTYYVNTVNICNLENKF